MFVKNKNKDKYNKNKERNSERKKLLKEKQNNKKENIDPLLDKSMPIEPTPVEPILAELTSIELTNNAPLTSSKEKVEKKIKSKPFKEYNKEMDSVQNEMKEIEFKNPIFEKNVIDPTNNKIVKSIYVHSWTKLARDHWFMIWQYYRDRKRTSIQEVYDKYKDTQLRIIYKGDPTMYYVGDKKEKPEPKIRNKHKENISE